MPKLTSRTPAYRRHSTGQAYVQLDGQRLYLGLYGSRASRAEYDRVIGVWLANGRQKPGGRSDDLEVNDVALAYWKHAQAYHATPSGHTGEVGHYRVVLKLLRKMYGPTRAADFGPLCLQAMQKQMIKLDWSRRHINAQVRRSVRMWKWAASQELVHDGRWQALASVPGLRAGKTKARELPPTVGIDGEPVDAVVEIAPPPVAAMIQLQQITGMRPGEVVQMRPADVDRSDPKLWVYRPHTHKTQHLDHAREIYLGERAQAVLRPFLDREASTHCFSPAESMAWTLDRRRAARKTPLTCGNRTGTHKRTLGRKPLRRPGGSYTTATYGMAIYNVCDRAFPAPAPVGPNPGESAKAHRRRLTAEQLAELKAWRKAHRWHPHQLRHAAATRLRKTDGLEAAQVILGHSTITVTQIYAQKNIDAAKAVMRREG